MNCLNVGNSYIKIACQGKVVKHHQYFLKNNYFKLIGNNWHEPVDDPEITLYSFNGNYNPKGSCFGKVRAYSDGKSKPHTGLDIFAVPGTPIYASLDGVVDRIYEQNGGYGKVLVIEIGNVESIKNSRNKYSLQYDGEIENGTGFNLSGKIYLRYAHLMETDVMKGDKVIAGQKIGKTGVSGNASGTKAPHLHFEISNMPRPPKGLNYRCNPAFYANLKNENDANKTIQEETVKIKHYND